MFYVFMFYASSFDAIWRRLPITIESLGRSQARRSYAATFLLPLPRTKFRAKIQTTKRPRKWPVFKDFFDWMRGY